MTDSLQTNRFVKSPLIFLLLVAVLVIATLVVASEYFLLPQIESELRQKVSSSFTKAGLTETRIEISGRDITLKGTMSSKSEVQQAEDATKQIWGIRRVDNHIMIKN